MTHQYLKYQDKLFIIKRRILDDPKYSGKSLDDLMLWIGSNKVLRKDNYLFFLEEVEEAEVIAWLPKEN